MGAANGPAVRVFGIDDVRHERYMAGDALIGEHFTKEQTEKWYEEEAQAYLDLDYNDEADYPYDALNYQAGLRHLDRSRLTEYLECPLSVVGLGSAHGQEFRLFAERGLLIPNHDLLTIVESDQRYYTDELVFRHSADRVTRMPVAYASLLDDGIGYPIARRSVDLVTCFGVLHHVAKVSSAINEISAILKRGGIALIREPITSMGDWRKPRPGLTKNERGIPLHLFQRMIEAADLRIVHETLCGYNPLRKLTHKIIGKNMCSSYALTKIDLALCAMHQIRRRPIPYHPESFVDRFAPSNVFYVLQKR